MDVFPGCSSPLWGGLEQELCLPGEVATFTAPGPSAEDRITHPSAAIAHHSRRPCPVCTDSTWSWPELSAFAPGLAHTKLVWDHSKATIPNTAQDLGTFPTPGQAQAIPACYLHGVVQQSTQEQREC